MILAAAATLLLNTSVFFAALALALRFRNNIKTRRLTQLHHRWEPAMLEILGGAAAPEEIFERVDEVDTSHFLSFLMGYTTRLRGDEQAMVRSMAAPYLPTRVDMVRGGTAESRGNAVLMLARMGMPKYAATVAGALQDESPTVAMIAARSLFRPGHEEYFPAVLENLSRFTMWSRSFLASMLAGGGPRAAPHLREILRDADQPPLARAVASDALRDLNDLESVDVAMELLASEPDRELVAGCLRIIKQLGHRDHVPAVRSKAASRDPVIRATAASALGAIGGPSEIPLLRDTLDDPSFWVSLEAARGLRALGDGATLERHVASGGPGSILARQVLSE